MSNFNNATGLLGTVVVAGTTLIGLKIATDFIGGAIENTTKSYNKSKKSTPKPFKPYKKMNFGYDYYSGKKSKNNDIFTIKF